MNLAINKSKVVGKYFPVPSKSVTHRALICSFLAPDKSIITSGEYESQDILDTLAFGKALGKNIEINNQLQISPKKNNINNYIEFDIKESASTLRFAIPILYALGLEFRINCSESLLKRPLDEYDKLFSENNIFFKHDNNNVLGKGKLKPGNFVINGNVSSQYVSGLLFALPLLEGNSTLEVNNLESKDYVYLTIAVLKEFGINIYYENNKFIIQGNQTYNGTTYNIEGDYTQTISFAVLGMINGDISIDSHNLNSNSLQGDKRVFDMLCEKYGNFQTKDFSSCEGLEFDIRNNPDLGPILMILCLFTGGKIINAERLAYKESNRITSMIEELKKINVSVSYCDGTIMVKKYSLPFEKQEAIFDTHNDHRICMALAILATCTRETIINNYECVNKSYPNFFSDLKKLGCKIEVR